jgi:phage tail-like protein
MAEDRFAPSHPVTAFHFRVQIDGIAGVAKFQEVSGLEVQVETDTIKEGGNLEHEIRIPTRSKFGNVTLKRGIFADRSGLFDWANEVALQAREKGTLTKYKVTITLLNAHSHSSPPSEPEPVMVWTLNDAFPVKYSVTPLNSMENALAFETLELCYKNFSVEMP